MFCLRPSRETDGEKLREVEENEEVEAMFQDVPLFILGVCLITLPK
jgi:hypothetical protein